MSATSTQSAAKGTKKSAGKPLYSRILLKVSGEALMGDTQYGIDVGTVDRIAEEIQQACDAGVEVCLVIGGGLRACQRCGYG